MSAAKHLSYHTRHFLFFQLSGGTNPCGWFGFGLLFSKVWQFDAFQLSEEVRCSIFEFEVRSVQFRPVKSILTKWLQIVTVNKIIVT